jgi:hypothetical protein
MDEGGSVDAASLSEEAPWRGPRGVGSSFTGDPGRHVKKISGYGSFLSMGNLSIRGELGMWGGGAYTGDE